MLPTKSWRWLAVLVGAVIALMMGCSSQPKLDVTYFHAMAATEIKVVQTAACTDGPAPRPTIVADLVVNTEYSADRDASYTLSLDKLSGAFSDTEFTFEFYGDGRLKAINTKQTGRGKEIIGAAATLAATVLSPAVEVKSENFAKACQALTALSSKPVSITRVARTGFEEQEGKLEVNRPEIPDSVFDRVKPIFGDILISYIVNAKPPVPYVNRETTGIEKLQLKHPTTASIIVKVQSDLFGETEFQRQVSTPQHGTLYDLPIQHPSLFGGARFQLALSESGNVTKLGYATSSGAADVLTVTNDILDAATTSDQEKLAALKLEADLIKAQQRLAKCKTDPEICE